MKERAPAFLFYVSDWLGDDRVIMMSAAERGIYIDLLAHAWREGSLSSDTAVLARIVRESLDDFLKAWERVGECFAAREDGRLVNPRLEKERSIEAERQRQRAERARKGAKAANERTKSEDQNQRKRGASGARARHERTISGAQAEDERGIASLEPANRSEANGIEDIPPHAKACDPPGSDDEKKAEPESEREPEPEKPKARAVEPPLPEDVDFGDLEPDVGCYVANAAAENKTGKISPRRIITLRRELWVALEEIGETEAFRFGLNAANAKGVPNVNYVRQAAKSEKIRAASPPRTLRSAPEPPHNPDHDMIPDPIDPNTTDLAALFSKRQR